LDEVSTIQLHKSGHLRSSERVIRLARAAARAPQPPQSYQQNSRQQDQAGINSRAAVRLPPPGAATATAGPTWAASGGPASVTVAAVGAGVSAGAAAGDAARLAQPAPETERPEVAP
jgi:hypothetical protein